MTVSLAGWVLLLSAMLSPGTVPARTAAPAGLVIRDAWVRASTATRTSSSAYLTIDNGTPTGTALVKIGLNGVGDAQVHTMVEQHGQATMRLLAAVPIAAHAVVELAPGGTHVMLMDIARPLQVGTTVAMTLTFDNGWTRTVRAVVRPLSAVSVR
jgi:copper(I)-binding protein